MAAGCAGAVAAASIRLCCLPDVDRVLRRRGFLVIAASACACIGARRQRGAEAARSGISLAAVHQPTVAQVNCAIYRARCTLRQGQTILRPATAPAAKQARPWFATGSRALAHPPLCRIEYRLRRSQHVAPCGRQFVMLSTCAPRSSSSCTSLVPCSSTTFVACGLTMRSTSAASAAKAWRFSARYLWRS